MSSPAIDRARKHGFGLRKPKRSAHDSEVLTHYTGQLIQHDAPLHLRAPAVGKKWWPITSLRCWRKDQLLDVQQLKTIDL